MSAQLVPTLRIHRPLGALIVILDILVDLGHPVAQNAWLESLHRIQDLRAVIRAL